MPALGRKPPQQARSRQGEKALLLAGLKSIQARGVAGLNMADVAAEAGASIGSLYFRFGDKDQFVGAVLDIALEEFHARGIAMCEKAEREKWTERRVLESWISLVVTTVRERQALVREMTSHMATRPAAWKPIHERRRQLEDRLLAVLSQRPGNGIDAARKKRLRIGLQIVGATVIHMVIVDPGPLRIDTPSLRSILRELLFSFVDTPAGNNRKKRRGREALQPD